MDQHTLTRTEAIDALIVEFTNTDEFHEEMEEERRFLLCDYLVSDEYMEAMADAQAEILAEYEASDEFEQEMEATSDTLITAHREYLESLTDKELGEQVDALIVPEEESGEGNQ